MGRARMAKSVTTFTILQHVSLRSLFSILFSMVVSDVRQRKERRRGIDTPAWFSSPKSRQRDALECRHEYHRKIVGDYQHAHGIGDDDKPPDWEDAVVE